MRLSLSLTLLPIALASDAAWTALLTKVSSELKPATEPTGFASLLRNPTATGAHGVYTYASGAVAAGINSWAIPADVKQQAQSSVGSVILVAKSVEYRSFTLKIEGGSGVLHEFACAGRHLPDVNGALSDNVELAFTYAQASVSLIQQTQDHAYSSCCAHLMHACIRHCTKHETINRGFTASELSVVLSVLVDQCYKYIVSIPAPSVALAARQPRLAVAPVTQGSMQTASAALRQKVESTHISNALVAKAIGRGFEAFSLDGVVETLTYDKTKAEQLVPLLQQVLGAPEACSADIAMAVVGASFVTDSGGTQWSHHTLSYSISDDKLGSGATNFAQFIVRVTRSNPDQRTLFLFKLTSSFVLAPDVIFLRSCSSSAGFLGIGSSSECHDVPTYVPHTLDLASLDILDSYLTAVGLSLVSQKLPNSDAMQLFNRYPVLLDRQVPAEFEGVLALMRGRFAQDEVAMRCSSGCSEPVRQLVNGALSKWSSSLEVQSMQKLTADGAPMFIKFLSKSVNISDPEFSKTLEGVLTSVKPLVYSTLFCNDNGSCEYFLLIGNSTVGKATDLLIVRESASFELAPELLVVRETTSNATSNNTVDKIAKVPRSVTKADIDAVLAFFEIAVVDRLSHPVSKLAAAAGPASNTTPSSPSMPGKTPQPVPEWQSMLTSVAGDSKMVAGVLSDIAAGTAVAGPIGGVIGGVIGLIPVIASIFHTSHSHSEQFIGELQNDGFSHFEMYQSGPIYYNKVPYHAVQAGKTVNPVEMVMTELMNSHLSDVANPQDQDDIKTYVMTLANGWASGSNVFVSSGIHYATKNGGGAKVVKFVTHADTENGHASIMFWSTRSNIQMADRLLVYRVTDQSSNLFHSSSSQRDEIRRIPRDINYTDVNALFDFFDIMAAKAFATSLNLCAATKLKCDYPSIAPSSSQALFI